MLVRDLLRASYLQVCSIKNQLIKNEDKIIINQPVITGIIVFNIMFKSPRRERWN